MSCGFKWDASVTTWPGQTMRVQGYPYEIPHPGKSPQKCSLPHGHDGPHRSLTGVICRAPAAEEIACSCDRRAPNWHKGRCWCGGTCNACLGYGGDHVIGCGAVPAAGQEAAP